MSSLRELLIGYARRAVKPTDYQPLIEALREGAEVIPPDTGRCALFHKGRHHVGAALIICDFDARPIPYVIVREIDLFTRALGHEFAYPLSEPWVVYSNERAATGALVTLLERFAERGRT